MKNVARRADSGFALLLTIALASLLIVLVVGLAAISRTAVQINASGEVQRQARQNALAGLAIALGELQRYAGADNVVTGMAGVTGAPRTNPGPNNPVRHWCGVWSSGGVFLTWLSSSSNPQSQMPQLSGDIVQLVGPMSVGDSNAIESENREFVHVDRIAITEFRDGYGTIRTGSYGYWVGDEGVKLTAYSPDAEAAIPSVRHAINEIISTLSPNAARLDGVLAHNQLSFCGTGTNPITAVSMAPGFHQITLAHFSLLPGGSTPPMIGRRLNVNSTSSAYWRGIAATYNQANPGRPLSITPTTFGTRMRNNFVTSTGGAPFLSPDAFAGSALLTTALASTGVSRADFINAIGAMLTTRSDTFRIRAYGDVVDPVTGVNVLGRAYCEAMVQRIPDDGPPGMGRRFVITYFRWLTPADI